MPYVKQQLKDLLNSYDDSPLTDLLNKLNGIGDEEIEGALNYVFTELLSSLKRDNGNWKYRYLNRAVGVLECCKLELYRRAAAPYEDKCIKNNGDVEVYKDIEWNMNTQRIA